MKKFGKIPSPLSFRDENGNVAMLFAIMASAAAALLGATIELGRISSAKASLNAAADAAALATKRAQMEHIELGETASRRKGEEVGRRMFEATRPKLPKGVTAATAQFSWDADDSARVVATGDMDLILGMLIGQPTMGLRTHSVATAGSDKYLEVALVLDTTASMFATDGRKETRFTKMRSSAKTFVNTLFDTVSIPDRLRVSVIPWTTTVNIRSETPLSWSDSPAPSRNVPDYGTRDMPSSQLNRAVNLEQNARQLSDLFAPVEWRGCVSGETEKTTLGEDIAGDAAVPRMKWKALQVPPWNRQANTYQARQVQSICEKDCYSPPPPPPPPGGGTQGYFSDPSKPKQTFAFLDFGKTTQNTACVPTKYECLKNICDANSKMVRGLDCWQGTNDGTANGFFNFSGERKCRWGGCLFNLTPMMVSGCIADYNEIKWNSNGGRWCYSISKSEWTSQLPIAGPNLNCPMPMLGLSANRKQIIDTIDRLSPAPGGTHGDVGLRWGLRSLSPRSEWANFFRHRAPNAFGSNQSSKIMVLITDGSNEEAFDFPGYYGCSDPKGSGCSKTLDRDKLDKKMMDWCRDIRVNYKVELYTVAVNVDDAAAVNLLKECAGNDPKRAYSVDASELDVTFTAIARSTFGLRIKE